MSVDKILHNYRTPLKASLVVSQHGLTINDFLKAGVIVNGSDGKIDTIPIENKTSYYLTNNGTSIEWKSPPWLEIDAPSSITHTQNPFIKYPSAYRRITISQTAPQPFDGAEGDVWFTFV